MSKRFTDSSKWDKGFFSELTSKMKLAWLYLCDKCDHAGVWDINIKLLSFQTGEFYHLDEIVTTFGDKIYIKDDKLLIIPFIEFQYGSLNSDNRVHQSVISKLEKLGLYKVLTSPLQGAKDKDKEKDKDKNKEKEDSENFENSEKQKRALQKLVEQKVEQIYLELYPLKKGKSAGIKKLFKELKTLEDVAMFEKAVKKYISSIDDPKFTKYFSTFASEWTDWLDPQAGEVVGLKAPEKTQPGQPKRISYESAESVAKRNREAEESAKNSTGLVNVQELLKNINPALAKNIKGSL